LLVELEERAAPDGLSQVPIHTFKDYPVYDDPISPPGCPYSEQANVARWSSENKEYSDTHVFKDYMYLVDMLSSTFK
jgi:hypothetical protein